MRLTLRTALLATVALPLTGIAHLDAEVEILLPLRREGWEGGLDKGDNALVWTMSSARRAEFLAALRARLANRVARFTAEEDAHDAERLPYFQEALAALDAAVSPAQDEEGPMSFAFEGGNSDVGSVGFVARVVGNSVEEALATLRAEIDASYPDGLTLRTDDPRVAYLRVYFNSEKVEPYDLAEEPETPDDDERAALASCDAEPVE